MKVPRFWHREWLRVPSKYKDGETWSIPRWGWSETSEEEAERMAVERCWQTKQRWDVNVAGSQQDWYRGQDYFVQPPREEIVEEINNAEGGVDGWVSRNRYGVLVLNTDILMIMDLDRQETPLRKAVSQLWATWFGRPVQGEEERLIALFQAQVKDSFRLYRTSGGWRAILLNRAVNGVDADSVSLMKKFPVDPFYLKLCEQQRCYRARLTAKPWRIGVNRCNFEYPRHPHQEEYFSRWEQEYNAAATKFRVCEKIYGGEAPCERLKVLVEIHDTLSQVDTSLPLA